MHDSERRELRREVDEILAQSTPNEEEESAAGVSGGARSIVIGGTNNTVVLNLVMPEGLAATGRGLEEDR